MKEKITLAALSVILRAAKDEKTTDTIRTAYYLAANGSNQANAEDVAECVEIVALVRRLNSLRTKIFETENDERQYIWATASGWLDKAEKKEEKAEKIINEKAKKFGLHLAAYGLNACLERGERQYYC